MPPESGENGQRGAQNETLRVWAYTSSFFSLPKRKYIRHPGGQYPFQSAVDLWMRGLVPSFDGNTWRLHAGPGGRVIYETQERMAGTQGHGVVVG